VTIKRASLLFLLGNRKVT